MFLNPTENVACALLITRRRQAWWIEIEPISTICTMALTGHVQYSWCVDVLKASFVRVHRNSSQLSISLSQVTVSREKRCCGTKRHHVRAARFPSHDRCGQTELELTHDYCVMTRVKWATVLPITLFGLASDCCQRAQQLRHDSGITTVLTRCDNNFIPVEQKRSTLSAVCSGNMQIPLSILNKVLLKCINTLHLQWRTSNKCTWNMKIWL